MNCFRIFEKAPHATCTCEDSTVICWNKCHHWYTAPQYRHRDGTRFVLKSFFVYKYLWGVSRQLSQPWGWEAANLSRQWKLTSNELNKQVYTLNWGFRSEWIVSVSKQNIDHGAGFGANTSLQCSQRSQRVAAVALEPF